jgi:hypothetical protein
MLPPAPNLSLIWGKHVITGGRRHGREYHRDALGHGLADEYI